MKIRLFVKPSAMWVLWQQHQSLFQSVTPASSSPWIVTFRKLCVLKGNISKGLECRVGHGAVCVLLKDTLKILWDFISPVCTLCVHWLHGWLSSPSLDSAQHSCFFNTLWWSPASFVSLWKLLGVNHKFLSYRRSLYRGRNSKTLNHRQAKQLRDFQPASLTTDETIY